MTRAAQGRDASQRGFTLIEMIIAIVIIGVALAGLVSVMSTTVGRSGDPVIRKQALVAAEQMLEEIMLLPHEVQANGAVGAGCARRLAFNDVRDFEGYTESGLCGPTGTAVAELADYALSVQVSAGQALPAAGGAPAVANALRVVVTVASGRESVALTGWRTP